jgi:hypothetical protein
MTKINMLERHVEERFYVLLCIKVQRRRMMLPTNVHKVDTIVSNVPGEHARDERELQLDAMEARS